MNKKLLTLFSLFFSFTHLSYGQLPSFQETVKMANMTFTMPDGFKEVPAINNNQMNYSYAIKDTVTDLEFLYRIDIIDTLYTILTHTF